MTEAGERLFFALWPDVALRRAIVQTQQVLLGRRGPRITPEDLHLTLVFLGQRSASERVCIEALAARMICPAFAFVLDSVGHWPRPRILWIGPAHFPAPLLHLHGALAAGLARSCGIAPEDRPFHPHVTLARKAQRPPPNARFAPLEWAARDFCLVRSEPDHPGAHYTVIGRWPLAPP